MLLLCVLPVFVRAKNYSKTQIGKTVSALYTHTWKRDRKTKQQMCCIKCMLLIQNLVYKYIWEYRVSLQRCNASQLYKVNKHVTTSNSIDINLVFQACKQNSRLWYSCAATGEITPKSCETSNWKLLEYLNIGCRRMIHSTVDCTAYNCIICSAIRIIFGFSFST